MKTLKYILTLIVLISTFVGCSDDDLIENPPHIIAADNLYADLAGFEAGLNGLYAQFRREREGETLGSSNDLFIDPAVTGTDNMFGNQRSGWAQVGNDLNGRNHPGETHNRRLFEWVYRTINAANTLINRAENPDVDWTEAEKNRVIGEGRLFRAWAYRHATGLWGDVPLTIEESSGTNIITDWKRAPIAEVRGQMEADLLFAEANLPPTSSNDGKLVSGVATHYLAELYLTIGDNAKAKAKAESLINGGNFSLVKSRYGVRSSQPGTPFTDMFIHGNSNRSEGNTEVLWAMQVELEVNGGGINVMRRWHRGRSHDFKVDGKRYKGIIINETNGGRGLGRVGPTRYAMELYDDNDDRGGRFAWRTYEVLNNPDLIPAPYQLGDTIFHNWKGKNEKERVNEWPSTRKWDYANPSDLGGARSYNDMIYLRLGETYLILAEAQYNLGDAGGAATTINVLRDRANAPHVSAGDIDVDFILDERSRELFSEEHRRYTLVRLGKWHERMVMYNKVGGPKADSYHRLMPIPQTVIDANETPIAQNPGYPD